MHHYNVSDVYIYVLIEIQHSSTESMQRPPFLHDINMLAEFTNAQTTYHWGGGAPGFETTAPNKPCVNMLLFKELNPIR